MNNTSQKIDILKFNHKPMYKYIKQITALGFILIFGGALFAVVVPCSVPKDGGQCVSDPSVDTCHYVPEDVPSLCSVEGVNTSGRCSKEGNFRTISLYDLKYCGGRGTTNCYEIKVACGTETTTKCKTVDTGDTCKYRISVSGASVEKEFVYEKCENTNVSGPNNYKPGEETYAY